MIRFVCTRKSDVDEQAVVQKKKEPESLVKKDMRVVNECKCTDKKNENGDIIGKTCIKKIESNGKNYTKLKNKKVHILFHFSVSFSGFLPAMADHGRP